MNPGGTGSLRWQNQERTEKRCHRPIGDCYGDTGNPHGHPAPSTMWILYPSSRRAKYRPWAGTLIVYSGDIGIPVTYIRKLSPKTSGREQPGPSSTFSFCSCQLGSENDSRQDPHLTTFESRLRDRRVATGSVSRSYQKLPSRISIRTRSSKARKRTTDENLLMLTIMFWSTLPQSHQSFSGL